MLKFKEGAYYIRIAMVRTPTLGSFYAYSVNRECVFKDRLKFSDMRNPLTPMEDLFERAFNYCS